MIETRNGIQIYVQLSGGTANNLKTAAELNFIHTFTSYRAVNSLRSNKKKAVNVV